jgi:hypothetical protein
MDVISYFHVYGTLPSNEMHMYLLVQFIIEGLVSLVIGVSCFWILPDTPTLSTRWLQPGEIRFLNLIHQATRGSSRDELAKKQVDRKTAQKNFFSTLWMVMKDSHIYLQAMVYMSNTVPNYGLKFTMPQIIRNMGFTSTNAQLLTAPPYLAGAITAVVVAGFADKSRFRFPFILGPQFLLIVAYSVLFVKADKIESNVALCYVMVILACMGVYPIM